MTFSELFVKRTSAKLSVPEDVVETIINHQWKSAKEAAHNVNQIEISGVGKFFVSEAKTKKKINKLEDIKKAYLKALDKTDEKKVETIRMKLKSVEQSLEELNKKLDRHDKC